MTPEQKAAFIVAQTAMMNVECEILRARAPIRPASSMEWEELRKRWEPVLGYNAVIQLFHHEV